MPGAGTDKTKRWVEQPGPVVILVEPQMGENIGSAARAMANFGLSRLRLVKPREEWPNPQARKMASGADRVLDGAELYDSVEAAIADCTLVLATTARAHDQAKPVVDAAGGGAGDGRAGRGRRDGRHPVRPRADRAREPRGRRSPTTSSPCRSIRRSPRSISPRRCMIVAYEWFKHATSARCRFRCRSARRRPASSSSGVLSDARSANWRRSSSSGRPTSATPCRSTCATSSRACSRPSRISARCTA